MNLKFFAHFWLSKDNYSNCTRITSGGFPLHNILPYYSYCSLFAVIALGGYYKHFIIGGQSQNKTSSSQSHFKSYLFHQT